MSDLILAAEGRQVKQYTKEELVKETNVVLNAIHRDLGFRDSFDPYDKIRFVDYVSKYYKWITIKDVKLMFELYVVGKLDAPEHYGKWSAQFYIGVIRAYIELQNKAKINQRLSLPEPEITKEQIEKINQQFKVSIARTYNRYKETGRVSVSGMSLTTYEFWKKKGHFAGDPEVIEKDRIMASRELSEMMSEKAFKVEITQEEKDTRARLLSFKRSVRDLYNKFIEENQDIEKLIHG